MSRSVRWILPLCFSSLFWAFSFGLNAPLASLWIRDGNSRGNFYPEDQVHTLIGLNTSAYYLGIAMATSCVPWLLRCWGYRCLIAGMTISGLTAAAFPWEGSITSWFVIRFLNGMGGALSLIPLESYVNHQSAPERRAQNFGYYAFSFALGMALGYLVVLPLYSQWPRAAFAISGGSPLLGATVVVCWRPAFLSGPAMVEGQGKLAFGAISLGLEVPGARVSWKEGCMRFCPYTCWPLDYLKQMSAGS